MNLNIALEQFLLHCNNRGLSFDTMKCYKQFLGLFIKYVGNIDVASLDYGLISDYITHLYDRPISHGTVVTYLRHLEVFIKWLEADERIKLPFSHKIELPRTPKKVLQIYNDSEVKQIFECVHNDTPWTQYRNCAIVSLMLDSGLRQNEVSSVLHKDMQVDERLREIKNTGALKSQETCIFQRIWYTQTILVTTL